MYIAERLCWALEAAHQRGVVHRDIKPSNVILSPDTENEIEPKLIDFGLAKVAAVSSEKGLTRTGQIVGTPDYMSPEQIANKEVDARSDVYSLGCLVFEMCVGRPPFTGGDDVQVLYQQLQVKPDRVEDHVPDAPPEIDKLLSQGAGQGSAGALPVDARDGRGHRARTAQDLSQRPPAKGDDGRAAAPLGAASHGAAGLVDAGQLAGGDCAASPSSAPAPASRSRA